MSEHSVSPPGTVSLADEEAVREVLIGSVLGAVIVLVIWRGVRGSRRPA